MESIVWGWGAWGIGHRGMISWLSAREHRAAGRAGRLSLPGLAVFVVSGMAAHRIDVPSHPAREDGSFVPC
jgi:hypothetical protein